MSVPNACGLAKRNRDHIDSSCSEDDNCEFILNNKQKKLKKTNRRHVAPNDAAIIPKFLPEDGSNVKAWLHTIDQFGDIYGWDDNDRICVMQLRLRGAARDWYNDLESYDMTWEEWKHTLLIAFPRSADYVDKLERMLARTKQNGETIAKYYHEKLSLLKKCNIDGQNAISCIIRGLPVELRVDAKAYNCETPEQLYDGYLSALGDVNRVILNTPREFTRKRGNSAPKTSSSFQNNRICYFCRRPGHEVRDCKQKQHCENCQRNGHTTATCWFGPGS